jgi:multidrug efflux system membrane fusion protein
MAARPAVHICCAIAVLLALAGCGKKNDNKQAASPAPPVVVTQARQQQVPLEIRAIGNVEAYSTVPVRARVSGPIERVSFEEGQDVKKGQLLFEIDPREFQQAVLEAEAAVANARAAQDQAQANYERDVAQAGNARAQASRYSTLASKGIIAREQNEQYETAAVAAEKTAAASKTAIASAAAAVQGAEAKLADARLQLSYTRIEAPVSGRTGTLLAKTGNLVTANAENPLVVINQIAPAFARFTIPEGALGQLRDYAARGALTVKAVPPNSTTPVQGSLDFLDNEVDPATGTITLKALFPNTDRKLWPGQFVNVAVELAQPTETVVPTAAVRTAQNGSYVFVVKPDLTAEQRTVEPSRDYGDLTVIRRGVNAGERVIVEGQLRVKPGDKVQIVQQPQSAANQPQFPVTD